MDDIQKHFTDSIIHSDLNNFKNETSKSIYIDKLFNKTAINRLQSLNHDNMILILIKDKTSLDENAKESMSSLHDADYYINQIKFNNIISLDAYNEYRKELNEYAESESLIRQEVHGKNELLGYKYIKPFINTKIKAIYNNYDYKNLKDLNIKKRLYRRDLENYPGEFYWIDGDVIPESDLVQKELDKFYNSSDKSGIYQQLYKGGKRKSRRNRKSKKGKRSRKSRKSRRKSNRRRGRR